MNSTFKAIAGIIGAGIVMALFIVWIVYFRTPTVTPDTTQSQFGSGTNNGVVTATPVGNTNEEQTVVESTISTQKIFKISSGPVAGATLIDTVRPTSTIARFVLSNNGHIFDYIIDSPGAVPKAISNTTIPGIVKVLWSEGGRGALLQYLDIDTLKTAHFALSAAAATTSVVRIQFLPTGAESVSVSPDGSSVAYLLKTGGGSDGYIARADGANIKRLFTLPFSQLILSWPANNTLLAYTPSAAGVPGAAFSIDAKNGTAGALLYASGLTATADRNFSNVLYQVADESSRDTYVQNVRSGLSIRLPFNPMPELCKFSLTATTTVFCPTPTAAVSTTYTDLWHFGSVTTPHAIMAYNILTGRSSLIATPGSSEGGDAGDIAEIGLSQTDNYLLFIKKSDRSLWGVRLKD